MAWALADDPGQDPVVAGNTDQREADDEHAGDGAAPECDRQSRRDASPRGLRDAGVRAHGHVHPDIAGGGGQQPADREPDRDPNVLDRDQDDEQDHADARDRGVLAVQVGAGTFLHGGGYRLHPLAAGR